MKKEFLALTHCGQFVDYHRLYRGIYTVQMPCLFPIETTIENLVDVIQAFPFNVIGYSNDEHIENLNLCELTPVLITASQSKTPPA
jgi:hypothetical protein